MMRLVLACVALLACACSRPAGPVPLRVGMELAYPPFEMTDTRGQPAGVSPDLARALGAALARPVEIQNIPFDGLIPSLKTGKLDLVISSMTATPERARSILFSDAYLRTGLAMLAGAQSDVQRVEDLARPERTVAVKKGTTGHLYAVEHLTAARVLVLDKETSCVLEVVQGKADAFLYDQLSVLKNWEQHREATIPLLAAFQQEGWAIGVRQGDDALLAQVNAFLAKFKAEGGFDRLGDLWLREPKEAFRARGIPFVF